MADILYVLAFNNKQFVEFRYKNRSSDYYKIVWLMDIGHIRGCTITNLICLEGAERNPNYTTFFYNTLLLASFGQAKEYINNMILTERI